MAVGGDIVERGKFVQLWESMHRWALRKAGRVIVLGNDMRDRIIGKGIAPERVTIVRDGATFPASLPSAHDPIVQEIRCGFPFVALHAGNLGFYGAWDTLLKAAEILRNENSGLVFIGDGANRARLESAATQASASNVKFLPFRPFEQVQHVMMAGRRSRRHDSPRPRRRGGPEQAVRGFWRRDVRCLSLRTRSQTPRASSQNPAAV